MLIIWGGEEKCNVMIYLLFTIFLILYLFYFIWLIEASNINQQEYDAFDHGNNQIVSIIISARNETHNIMKVIRSLTSQNYDSKKYEIIIANDKSTDDTFDLLNKAQSKIKNLKIINVEKTPKNWSNKKWALNQCIIEARGDIIVQTDADCIHHPNWLIEITSPFFEPSVGFVSGPSSVGNNKNFWNELLFFESLAQECFSYSNAKRNLYISCTARNMAYRKIVFEQIKGYQNISNIESGDDDLLLHKIVTQTDWDIKFIDSKESLVYSNPPKTLNNFFLQRIRWASKGLLYYKINSPKEIKVILPFLYLINFLCVVSIVEFIYYGSILYMIPIFIKCIADLLLLVKYFKKLNIRIKIIYITILSIIHPFYIVLLGGLGPFIKYKWK